MKISKEENKKFEERIHEVLFPETEGAGMKVMCAVFPTNGLYVAEGLVRYVKEQKGYCVDVTDYFREMKMKDYYDLMAVGTLEDEAEKHNGGQVK